MIRVKLPKPLGVDDIYANRGNPFVITIRQNFEERNSSKNSIPVVMT